MQIIEPLIICNGHFISARSYFPNLQSLVLYFEISPGSFERGHGLYGVDMLLAYFTTLARRLPRSLDTRFDLRLLLGDFLTSGAPRNKLDDDDVADYRAQVIDALEKAFLPLFPGATTLPIANSATVGRELAESERE